ncbi:MAG: D-glycero-alpha-D-manno-heptose-1,7-bisphosphate 7-phosphatase [Saprospiraceae bacterium]
MDNFEIEFIKNIDSSWTLFLDRDGVINRRLPDDYVKVWSEFEFFEDFLEALAKASKIFQTIVIVTNQQGIGKGKMSVENVNVVHDKMVSKITQAGGRIDKIYICPDLKHTNPKCRKPNTGMAEQAQKDFPNIDFSKSIIVGDSASDIEMGKRLGMKRVFVTTKPEDFEKAKIIGYDCEVESFGMFVNYMNR